MDREAIAITIFAGYHIFIVFLFARIGKTINFSNGASRPFLMLAGVALVTTWFYMIKYYMHSYGAYSSTHYFGHDFGKWLKASDLFREAWEETFRTEVRWFWSQSLCSFVAGAFTVLLVSEGRARKIPHITSYFLLALLVSVSVSLALFMAAMATHPPVSTRSANPRLLHLSVLFNMTAIYFLPKAPYFFAALLFIHTLPLVPILLQTQPPVDATRVYSHAAAFSLYLNVRNLARIYVAGNLSKVLRVLGEHPAMSSLGADVIMCAVVLFVYTGWTSLIAIPGGIGALGFPLGLKGEAQMKTPNQQTKKSK